MEKEKEIKAAPTELGEEGIGKLLRKYAVPAIIAMTASSLYNMVDSIFIGQGVGSLAISGLAVTFPLMNISAAFGSLVGVGASALVSMLLGQEYRVRGSNACTSHVASADCLNWMSAIRRNLAFFGEFSQMRSGIVRFTSGRRVVNGPTIAE